MLVHAFLKSVRAKLNVIGQIEFELTYNDVAVQYVSHYALETPSRHLN